jgi:hypothetical protein
MVDDVAGARSHAAAGGRAGMFAHEGATGGAGSLDAAGG